jgi:hypothetical protein
MGRARRGRRQAGPLRSSARLLRDVQGERLATSRTMASRRAHAAQGDDVIPPIWWGMVCWSRYRRWRECGARHSTAKRWAAHDLKIGLRLAARAEEIAERSRRLASARAKT